MRGVVIITPLLAAPAALLPHGSGRVLASMEAQGVAVNPKVFDDLKPLMERRLQQLDADAAEVLTAFTGTPQRLDMSRPAEVDKALFFTMGLSPPPGSELP